MDPSKAVKWALGLLAAALAVVAGLLQEPLSLQSKQYEIVPADNVAEYRYPETTLLAVAPGGLRAVALTGLWLRSQKLMQEGRYFEAMHLAEIICRLQPHFSGVWDFQSWNMAWNISAALHTPEERWLWVSNGMRLLRDQGIPLNRKSLMLYKHLGWLFYFKMGQTLDEMHRTYKMRWGSQMQRLLGAPPLGTTEEVIAAFRPVAEAPLDKDPARQGRRPIQKDRLQALLANRAVAEYRRLLAARSVAIDESLLDIYNRYSRAEAVEIVRVMPPKVVTERDRALSRLINDESHAQPRGKVLAFLRAQVLWNVYRMDPEWMLKLMETYGPVDWRLPEAHGLYWITYGFNCCRDYSFADTSTTNAGRLVLNCLKELTWAGRVTYTENPDDPDSPLIQYSSDYRFIQPTQEEFERRIQHEVKGKKVRWKESFLNSGHINFLISAVNMLYAGYRHKQAAKYWRYVKEKYEPKGPEWEMDLEDFVIFWLNKDGKPIPEVARSQIHAALVVAFQKRMQNDEKAYRDSFRYAQRVYRKFIEGTPERNLIAPFKAQVANVLRAILVRPVIVGYDNSLEDRIMLYRRLDGRMQLLIYDWIAPLLARQCRDKELDFKTSFPPPPGLKEFRLRMRRRTRRTVR